MSVLQDHVCSAGPCLYCRALSVLQGYVCTAGQCLYYRATSVLQGHICTARRASPHYMATKGHTSTSPFLGLALALWESCKPRGPQTAGPCLYRMAMSVLQGHVYTANHICTAWPRLYCRAISVTQGNVCTAWPCLYCRAMSLLQGHFCTARPHLYCKACLSSTWPHQVTPPPRLHWAWPWPCGGAVSLVSHGLQVHVYTAGPCPYCWAISVLQGHVCTGQVCTARPCLYCRATTVLQGNVCNAGSCLFCRLILY